MAKVTQIRMYDKRGDIYPRYRVELPIVSLPAVEAFAKRYNIPQIELTVGYIDFLRDISIDDLKTWIQDGYISKLAPELNLGWTQMKNLKSLRFYAMSGITNNFYPKVKT